MNARWHLPFRWVSDADGERLAKPVKAWNPDERDGMFHPRGLLLAPDGEVLVRHRSRDVADRPDDHDVLEALGALGRMGTQALAARMQDEQDAAEVRHRGDGRLVPGRLDPTRDRSS